MDTRLTAARAALESGMPFAAADLDRDIGDSWARSVARGLDPRGEPRSAVIAYHEVRQARRDRADLMRHVRPELELLSTQIAGTNFMAAFASAEGVILDAIMDTEFAESACARAVRVGSVWTEELRGTNALGLALHTGRAATVTGSEHFFHRHAGVSCVSAPIFGSKGEILGLLDASSEIAARQMHTKALVHLAASNIENRLFVEAHRDDHILQFHPRAEYLATQSVAMISVDADGQVTGANRRAADFLTGLDLLGAQTFDRLFQDRFAPALSALLRGEDLRVRDWLNATYIMRLRLTRPRTGVHSVTVDLAAAAGGPMRMATRTEELVFADEQLREVLRIGQRALGLGLAVRITGPSGSGRTTLARHLHATCAPQGALVVVDGSRGADSLRAAVVETRSGEAADWIGQGGTLLIEDAPHRDDAGARALRDLVQRLIARDGQGLWQVILTATGTDAATDPATPDPLGIAALPIFLPALAARTDFDRLATVMMQAISAEHTLSASACDALAGRVRPRNLADLSTDLRLLAVRSPTGVIRRDQVERHLNLGQQTEACEACRGNPLREVKCQEIRKVYRQNHANIALAARRLGVSRNTVYKHVAPA